jgi:O-antigen ligase
MKKFKTLFLITLSINILTTIPLVLVIISPEMMEEMVFSQFVGINDVGKDALELIHFVFLIIAISMIAALIVSIRIKVKEAAQTAALILAIIHLGWVLPDIINLVSGNQHPPIPIMILTLIPVLVLFHAWKKAEI